MVVGLLVWVHSAEALTLAILATMLVGLWRLVRISLRLDAERPRQILATWQSNRPTLLRRTVFLAFLSVLLLSLSVHDVKTLQGVLPASLRLYLLR